MDTKDITAQMDAYSAELAQAKTDLREQMADVAGEAGLDVDTYMDPPVKVVCGFDGTVTGVEIDEKRRSSMTVRELAEAISAAGKHPRYSAPPVPEGGSSEERLLAMAAQARDAVAQVDILMGSVEAPSSVREVVGMNQARTVTVTYRGRFVAGIDCQEVWLSTASPAQIQNAVIEASRAGLQTIRTLDRSR